jgi:starch phosphorylase
VRKIHQFSVHPDIPPRLNGLLELAFNLRWAWDRRTFKVFEHLDPELLEKCANNPVLLLRRVSRERLENAVTDAAFLAHLDGAVEDLRRYLAEPGWFKLKYPERSGFRVGYFCMEFGLTACLPIYSGGLGVLAGDHLKSASGLDIPLVAVGLLYRKGYFVQRLDDDGWQHESYRVLDFGTLPVRPVAAGAPGATGRTLGVPSVEILGHGLTQPGAGQPVPGQAGTPLKVHVDIGARKVGRIPLYLLDTNLPENDTHDRRITSELYGGGPDERLSQELVLGIGGMRALKALGLEPQVCHFNEGHTVFAGLERIREFMREHHLTFREARQAAGAGALFTTHTPVPAGFDLFPEPLIESHLGPYLKEMDIAVPDFMRMGRANPDEHTAEFNVAALALRQAPRRNAVSRLHRRVTARMMQPGWVDFPRGDMPIESVTNGVHTKTWVAADMEQLYDHYLGPRWRDDTSSPDAWQRVERIPDLELWRTHCRLRERLVGYAREQVELQARERLTGGPLTRVAPPLRSDALTIGFARRFATYKRATLIFRDINRLKAILTNETRPVQLLVAGKAHPRDGAGKDFIREMLEIVRREGLSNRVVFLEDYDLRKAAMLVQGVDVWLNNPRRPFEACGTSGMKAVPNGGLNLSVLDGWWAEGYRPGVGWARIRPSRFPGPGGCRVSLLSLGEGDSAPVLRPGRRRNPSGLDRDDEAIHPGAGSRVLRRPYGEAVHRGLLSARGRPLRAAGGPRLRQGPRTVGLEDQGARQLGSGEDQLGGGTRHSRRLGGRGNPGGRQGPSGLTRTIGGDRAGLLLPPASRRAAQQRPGRGPGVGLGGERRAPLPRRGSGPVVRAARLLGAGASSARGRAGAP